MDWTELGRVAAENLTPVVLIILVGVIGAGVKVGLAHLEKWTGVQVSKAQKEMFHELSMDALYFAEEQALKALRAGDKTPDSDTKMEVAFKYAAAHAKALGLPEMARDRFVELIESNLMYSRGPDEMASSKKIPEDPEDTKVDLPGGKRIGGAK